MSQSSSASAPSSNAGGGGAYDGQGSPVAYRTGPLAYEPAVECRCNMKAPRWISWSNGNPGQRYHKCRRAWTENDCGFFRWVDEDVSDWFKQLLRDLRDEVWKLKKQLAKKEEEVVAKDMVLVAMQRDLEEKKKQIEDKQLEVNAKQHEANGKQQELEAKDQALQAMQAQLKNKNQCIDLLVVLCVLMLIIMVVILLNAKKA